MVDVKPPALPNDSLKEAEETALVNDSWALLVSTLMEGLRRNKRHLAIKRRALAEAYKSKFGEAPKDGKPPPVGSVEDQFQMYLPDGLIAFSHLGVFRFRLLGTTNGYDVAMFDQHHPMITSNHIDLPERTVVQELREMHPDMQHFMEGNRIGFPPEERGVELGHSLLSFASAQLNALFYYIVPNNIGACWIIIDSEVTSDELDNMVLPENIAQVTLPKRSYASMLQEHEDAHGPASCLDLYYLFLDTVQTGFLVKGIEGQTHRDLLQVH